MRAEQDLQASRQRREGEMALRRWFRAQYEANHMAGDIDSVFSGRHT